MHFRKTSIALDASVQSEQMCFQKSAEAVSGDTWISQIVRQSVPVGLHNSCGNRHLTRKRLHPDSIRIVATDLIRD